MSCCCPFPLLFFEFRDVFTPPACRPLPIPIPIPPIPPPPLQCSDIFHRPPKSDAPRSISLPRRGSRRPAIFFLAVREPRRERRGPSRVRPGRAARRVRPRQAPTTASISTHAASSSSAADSSSSSGSHDESGVALAIRYCREGGARERGGLVILFAGDLWSFSPKGETHRERGRVHASISSPGDSSSPRGGAPGARVAHSRA